MAKAQKSYVCQSCGAVFTRWAGKCDACEQWNTITEEITEASVPKGLSGKQKGRVIEFADLRDDRQGGYPRLLTRIAEFDRVTGGGIVPGAAVLIGGDPGIGKSTLLLQAVCALTRNNVECAYISGEESIDQIRMRADRLGLSDVSLKLASATSVRDILESVTGSKDKIKLLVIDSIQTMFVDSIDSAPGTVTQVRTSAQEIIRMAKSRGIAVVFIGHVTKDGQIAGPRILEHLVDTVLYFEGDRSHHFRILRAVKNRFGPTDEIGVFEMAERGLIEVANPSALFLSQRHEDAAGSAVLAALEGSRPLLVEVQALIAPSSLASPRRAVLGWDHNRLAMIVAVLETRCGVRLSSHDIFLNIAGGIRINEPAADLAVAAALLSALSTQPLPADSIFFGEIGLAGEVRQVAQSDIRLKESAKLGFERAIIPASPKKKSTKKKTGNITTSDITHIRELARLLGFSED
ncbi:MAG: DNA repair protein RadA [Alphaproteobacteria bacterium]|nr:DNA repair protein RadA [Alphaproteobacteria bacterium]